MYAITIPPATAYFLTTGQFQHACWWHNSHRLGEIYLGTVNVIHRPTIEATFNLYNAIRCEDTKLGDPISWYSELPRGALIATATLIECARLDESRLSDFERKFLPRNRFIYRFEGIKMLADPIYCQQQTGYIWEYDPERVGPKRYLPLTRAQINHFYDLCLHMDECHNDPVVVQELVSTHPGRFIFHAHYETLRSPLMRRVNGQVRVDRRRWKKVFAKIFNQDYPTEAKKPGRHKKCTEPDSTSAIKEPRVSSSGKRIGRPPKDPSLSPSSPV